MNRRPHPEALTRAELARSLGISYQRAYYWTVAGPGRRRAHDLVPPTWTTQHGTRHYDWFSPADRDTLAGILAALDRSGVQLRRAETARPRHRSCVERSRVQRFLGQSSPTT